MLHTFQWLAPDGGRAGKQVASPLLELHIAHHWHGAWGAEWHVSGIGRRFTAWDTAMEHHLSQAVGSWHMHAHQSPS